LTDLNAILLTAISFIKVAPTENNETNRKSGIAYAAALVLFTSVVSLCGAGWLLDRWLGTKPWMLVAGIVLGAIAGFYQFIRLTSQL
jgi:F0F1-type ATP synthase assembly protein I